MAGPYLFDRVRETTTTTGTGAVTLAGAVTGFRTFTSVLANSDTVYYSIAHQSAAEWEMGIGTFTTSGTTLTRTTVLSSSNSGSAVSFSAGTKDVFISPPSAVLWDRLPDVAVTGTTTATIDRMHVCSGTTSDYTVTLPAASGNAGRYIGFRMSTALTKIVTIDGNSSETINGALTRVMHDGEAIILKCDGSNWSRVAGYDIPMVAAMRLATTQTLTNATLNTILLNTSEIDTAGMVNTGSNRFDIKRTGKYFVRAYLRLDAGASLTAALIISINSASVNYGVDTHTGGGIDSAGGSNIISLTAGDTVQMVYYIATVGSRTTYDTDDERPRMSLAEIL